MQSFARRAETRHNNGRGRHNASEIYGRLNYARRCDAGRDARIRPFLNFHFVLCDEYTMSCEICIKTLVENTA